MVRIYTGAAALAASLCSVPVAAQGGTGQGGLGTPAPMLTPAVLSLPAPASASLPAVSPTMSTAAPVTAPVTAVIVTPAVLVSPAGTAALVAVVTPAVLVVATVAEDAEPALPAGAGPGFVTPAGDGAGGYLTPNRGLSGEETTWHLRVALNVAALGCRGALVDGYNALLTAHKATLAATADAVAMRYKARFGQSWQAQQDDAMTRLYNFWALPPAQGAFCTAAQAVLAEVATLAPTALPGFAATALPRIEAPLIAFFADYDRWRTAHAGWATRHRPAAPLVAVAAVGHVRIGAGEP